MQSNKDVSDQDLERILAIIRNLMEEINDSDKTLANLVSTNNQLLTKINRFDEKLGSIKITSPTVDSTQIRELLTAHLLNISRIVDRQPTVKTWKLKILPMPMQHSRLFFKVILGCFLSVAVIIAILETYQWFRFQALNKSNLEVEMETIKADKIVRSWNYLYSQKDKKLRRLMDSALKKTGNPNQR